MTKDDLNIQRFFLIAFSLTTLFFQKVKIYGIDVLLTLTTAALVWYFSYFLVKKRDFGPISLLTLFFLLVIIVVKIYLLKP